jgi:hypothetical protein
MRFPIGIGLVDDSPAAGGGGGGGVTKGELVDDNAVDFELVDDNGDIMLIED